MPCREELTCCAMVLTIAANLGVRRLPVDFTPTYAGLSGGSDRPSISKKGTIPMLTPTPTLHMLCGKIAAGKSTLAAELAAVDSTVLIAEDAWLAALFGDELERPKDYLRCAAKLRAAMAPHSVALLKAGLSVVLDFQANTVESRAWMRGLLDETQADHQCHVLMPPDAVCLARLRQRNAGGLHPFTVTEAQFHQIGAYFEPPTPGEGFNLIIHDESA